MEVARGAVPHEPGGGEQDTQLREFGPEADRFELRHGTGYGVAGMFETMLRGVRVGFSRYGLAQGREGHISRSGPPAIRSCLGHRGRQHFARDRELRGDGGLHGQRHADTRYTGDDELGPKGGTRPEQEFGHESTQGRKYERRERFSPFESQVLFDA